MKKILILVLSILTFSLINTNLAGAASYTLEPISPEESNVFKNKPTIIFRIGKDTESDFEKLKNRLMGYYNSSFGWSDPVKGDVIDAIKIDGKIFLNRLQDFRENSGYGIDTYNYILFKKHINEEKEFNNVTSPTIKTGSIAIRGYGYDCQRVPLKESESCFSGTIFSNLRFETHFVDVTKLEDKINELKNLSASSNLSEEEKTAIIKITEEAEAILNNQNSIQNEIDTAIAKVDQDLAKLEEDKKKTEEDKKLEEERRKLEQAKKDQQPTQSANPSPVITPSENNNPKTIKSPNTGAQKNSDIEILLGVCGISIISAIFFINRQKIFHQ